MKGKLRPHSLDWGQIDFKAPMAFRKMACLVLASTVVAGIAVLLCNLLVVFCGCTKVALLPSSCDKGRQELNHPTWMSPNYTSLLGPTTDAPMATLPPYEPTCILKHLAQMDDIKCPVLQCSKSPFCSVHDPRCCAYFNHQILMFVADYLESKCLEDQYYLLFGSALGAFREHSVLLHTGATENHAPGMEAFPVSPQSSA
jgi:hypothetical protein